MVVEEGGIDDELIPLIQQGKRRPSGQLVSVTIANQLGIAEAAQQRSARVMRIAVHPSLQRQNIGSTMLSLLGDLLPENYLSTSFGATAELIHFWRMNGFSLIKVGSQRDNSSGCHSVIMTKGNQCNWQSRAQQHYSASLAYRASDDSLDVEVDVLRSLFESAVAIQYPIQNEELKLIQNYVYGGSSLDSISFLLRHIIINQLAVLNSHVSDLLLIKVLQQKSWEECSSFINTTGRKQCEVQLRKDIELLLLNLHCKPIN
jgi:tRNA(Met) cytidine acetyltransferase